jgi:predicted small lipoprotein YifL
MPLGILRAMGLAAFFVAATGCGQTGPLTLPGPAAPASTPAGAPAAPADTDAAAEEDQTEQDER